jgi:hypothetical protein
MIWQHIIYIIKSTIYVYILFFKYNIIHACSSKYIKRMPTIINYINIFNYLINGVIQFDVVLYLHVPRISAKNICL